MTVNAYLSNFQTNLSVISLQTRASLSNQIDSEIQNIPLKKQRGGREEKS